MPRWRDCQRCRLLALIRAGMVTAVLEDTVDVETGKRHRGCARWDSDTCRYRRGRRVAAR